MLTLALAVAAATAPVQDYGYTKISAGNFAQAEVQLLAVRAEQPGEPSAMINLATVYARTGRAADAALLYQAALDAPNVQLELGNGSPAWSHDLARRGLNRMQFAAR